ncbi:cytochrome C biogenesis protein CcdA [Dulcicalothrix desertica PCC 7102]|uniref:Cytochrome C biogenesis protein CcdA n=1 Tax=Dulcicalothrix desertica PCC 7102 TaxID=232991 RepID=A0A433US02_9CYAN|nr:GAP family protein [Dulcicalothrix desertica]RUS96615.1 cytochrome C biogenesis protein CcdA [Dulcicalothrix desertica PCC 7102]TWH43867.1 cytochrome c biogenesis protein CcdA [Dulcicalothrix desertica PCC 7102]
MFGLLTYLGVIALADSINPTATILQIYLLLTPNPVRRSVAFIVGVFVAYFVAGWLFVLGFAKLIEYLIGYIGLFIYVIQFVIGVVMIGFALTMNSSSSQRSIDKPKVNKAINTFLLGLSVTFLEAPTALPYIIAIERIVQSRLNSLEVIFTLIFYNLIFVSPLLVLLLLYVFFREKSAHLILLIAHKIIKYSPKVFQILLLIIGIWLLIDSLYSYFR